MSENGLLPDLLETNIRQRGDVGGSAKKVGLSIKELDRIYENSRGGDRKSNLNNYGLNHAQMAKIMGISVSTLENYKKLTEMIPELEELVNTGIKRKATGGRSVQVAFSKFNDITLSIFL